jgi:hypothetical protein
VAAVVVDLVVEADQEEVPVQEEEDPNSWVPNLVTSQETA